MYKIIYNDMIIDVIKNPLYVRWLKRGKKFAKTEITSANGVRSSDYKSFYHLDTMPKFEGVEKYKTVKMVEIDEEEYNRLNSLMVKYRPVSIYTNEYDDPEVLKSKVVELTNEVNMLTECILEMSTVLYS